MNKRQKAILQIHLQNEKELIKHLKKIYVQAALDCKGKISALNSRLDMQNLQSIIYQKQYQQALKKQIDGILTTLQTDSFTTLSEYLTKCYENGYVGTMYDLQGQNVPLLFPIDQSQVVQAVQTDSKLSTSLYKRLGEEIDKLQKDVRLQISRGIVIGKSWLEIAAEIATGMTTPFKKAMNYAIRIARTEGHRIQNQAALDCAYKASNAGANIVKQWDATLDGRTRPDHQAADGQIRALDDYFNVGGEKMKAPGVGGSTRNVCNCRCCMLQRAKWALDEDETRNLGNAKNMTDADLRPIAEKLNISIDELRQYSDQIIPVKAKDYEDFRRQYEKIWNYKPVARRKSGQ